MDVGSLDRELVVVQLLQLYGGLVVGIPLPAVAFAVGHDFAGGVVLDRRLEQRFTFRLLSGGRENSLHALLDLRGLRQLGGTGRSRRGWELLIRCRYLRRRG